MKYFISPIVEHVLTVFLRSRSLVRSSFITAVIICMKATISLMIQNIVHLARQLVFFL